MKAETPGLTRRSVLGLFAAVGAGLATGSSAGAASLPPVEIWKDPNCGCCGGWARHMRAAGFPATVTDVDDMASIRTARGVPADLESCHTAVVDGYVVEGHVPAADVIRLIAERPAARGLAAPGMPASAPGMDEPGEAYAVILFGTPTGDRVYARHAG